MKYFFNLLLQHDHKKVLHKFVIMMKVSFIFLIITGLQVSANDFSQSQQGIQITGTVLDDTGDPMPGVNVTVKGTTTGVTSDINGKYLITVPNSNVTLVFSFIGYAKQEIVVGERQIIDVTLAEDAKQLEEVVVVAYGVSRRQDLTTAVEVVGEKMIAKTPSANLAQALQGNTSGVMVATNSADPGADVTIRIRGTASINAGNNPLVIIDNVPSEMSDFSALNPNDVISITVLKDAAATAPYGSRASNGVLMVTTRSGEKGKMQIAFSGDYSLLKVQNTMDVMNAYQFARYNNLAAFNAGTIRLPYQDPGSLDYKDYQGLLIKNGHYLRGNLQISGGTDKVSYFVSANVTDNKGITPNAHLSRLGVRARIIADLRPNLKFTFNSSVQRDQRQTLTNSGSDSGPFMRFAMNNPVNSRPGFLFEDGYEIDPETGERFEVSDVVINTLAQQNHSRPFSFSTNGQIDWKIIPGLTASVRGSVSYRDQLGYRYVPKDVQRTSGNAAANNLAMRKSDTRMGWFNENYLNYSRKINAHDFSLTLGHSVQKTVNEGFEVTVYNFNSDLFGWDLLQGAQHLGSNKPDYRSSSSFKSMVSGFGIFGYNYKQKYYFNSTLRADGSSRFGDNNKWGVFPSASVAWNLKEEEFLRLFSQLSQTKIRFSWGITGNDGIGQGASMSTMNMSRLITLNGKAVTGAQIDAMGNTDIKWEKTMSYNLGLDLGLFNNAAVLTLDAYYKKTSDLLFSVSIPHTTGIDTQMQNIGVVENRGIEATLNTQNIRRQDFRWTTNFNISWNANKVLDLGGEDWVAGYDNASGVLASAQVGNGGALTFLKVGQPMFIFMGYKSSVWQSWDEIYALEGPIGAYVLGTETAKKILPGQARYWGNGYYYKDAEGGLILDEHGNPKMIENGLSTEIDDRVILGHTMPDITFGFTNTFTYKNFELGVFFVGAWGNKIFNGNNSNLFRWTNANNASVRSLDAYRTMNVLTGDVGYSGQYPTPQYTNSRSTPGQSNVSTLSSNGMNTGYPAGTSAMRYLEDGSYLRLKSLSLTYNLPRSLCQKISIQSLSVSLNAMNLWTLTKYSGMDPEMNSTQISSEGNADRRFGVDTSASPAYKTYTCTLNFKF